MIQVAHNGGVNLIPFNPNKASIKFGWREGFCITVNAQDMGSVKTHPLLRRNVVSLAAMGLAVKSDLAILHLFCS